MAKDLYHKIVREILELDGWTITHDPYLIEREKRKAYEVDLGAEKIIAAEKGTIQIAVEVKSFLGSSRTYDFHGALGQYNVYSFFMTEKDPNRKLFLAITEEVFDDFFQEIDTQMLCNHYHVNILVFNAEAKIVSKWLKN
jgi:hypothetical protein